MYERFTDRARKVMQLANQEAQRFSQEYIGTEHILLGLLREEEGVAAQVLLNLGLKLEDVRNEVLNLLNTAEVSPPGWRGAVWPPPRNIGRRFGRWLRGWFVASGPTN